MAGLLAVAEGGRSRAWCREWLAIRRCVFVFPGRGVAVAGMAADLLDSAPVFARGWASATRRWRRGWTGRLWSHVLRGTAGAPACPELARGPDRVDVVQPVLWAVMVGLPALWESVGVRPAAWWAFAGRDRRAVLAGGLSVGRGPSGGGPQPGPGPVVGGREMVSVACRPPRWCPWRLDELGVAAVNGPTSMVVSGAVDGVARGTRVVRETGEGEADAGRLRGAPGRWRRCESEMARSSLTPRPAGADPVLLHGDRWAVDGVALDGDPGP